MPHRYVTLSEAANLIHDNQTIALGGMTIYRRPVAFVRELLRREARPKNLTLLNFTAGFESDLLVGAGCVGIVRSVYFGLEAFGLAPMFTEAAQQGRINIMEETEASIVMGMRARMAGVGFMPSTAWIGTDLPKLRPDVKTVVDPYTGETLTAFPAIDLDVVILHGLEGDRHGNVTLNNNLGIDMELVYIADTVIVTVERIVDRIEKSIDRAILPAPGSDFIVHVPNGAWPTSCHPLYPVAGRELMRYVDACNAGNFDAYLAAFLEDASDD
ncbi:MAG: CoA transferase subunit A [Chloroflexi bacterium]|nr:MAG: CoA transferase subunit A [Phototrophicales bacterium]RMF79325.1 MAG: CoA transferase subunit A [Chloroflexota bacterium]